MLTSRGIGALVAALILYVASRVLGVGELQLAAVGALGLVVAAAAFVWSASVSMEVSRSVRPARLGYGGEGSVELTVRNVGRLPTATVEVREEVPLVLSDAGPTTLRTLPPGGRALVTVPLRGGQRGRFTIGPLAVTVRDPFLLVARDVSLPGHGEVVVYPPVWELPSGLPLGGAQDAGGDGASRPIATGEDRSTVREYVQGDDLRSVHWASTAHRGKLMVRQAESPQDPRAVLLLDVREDRHRGHGPGASVETAVAAAASAAYHLAGRGRGVVVVDDVVGAPPRARTVEGWLAHLAEVRARPVDLDAVLLQLAQGIAGDGALVAVLTVPAPAELRALVRAGRGFTSCAAVLVDAEAHAARARSRAGTGEIDGVAGRLRAAGWRVIVVGPDDHLPARWRELVAGRSVAISTGGG